MKKNLTILGAVILTAAAITFSLVHWNNKIEVTSAKAKEKIEVVKKTDPNLTGHAPVNNIGTADVSGSADSSGNQGSDSGAGTGTQSSNDGTETTATANSGDAAVEAQGGTTALPGTSLEEIKAAYQEVFTQLEVQESSKVDQIVVQAKADFVSKKYSKDELIAKYQEFAELLETNADKTFDAYYKQFQLDLEKYGYDVNDAVPFKNEYTAKKQERMTQVISELSQF
ncbi:hypothetical protein [Bacillus benzoevorans]|uniref:Uncharacterized protein n=1 Tax=Bacillus benzoevorans TaxID=1456 RepID=A0A7X0HSM1_9BACI|nr:hypothetical protein [Bacillus benzoevorans]MBB6446093.1 hypothetical protein [Bacillus benzoevorans]